MINAQLITILVVFLSVMVGILVNNSRMSDMRAAVDARITDSNRHVDESLARFEKKLDRMEENIMRLLADHDARLRQLEQAKG